MINKFPRFFIQLLASLGQRAARSKGSFRFDRASVKRKRKKKVKNIITIPVVIEEAEEQKSTS